jgi:hypothetical protein
MAYGALNALHPTTYNGAVLRGDKYGPNSRQVEAFLQRVRRLSSPERESVAVESAAARAAFGWSKIDEVQVAAFNEYQGEENRWLGAAGDELKKVAATDDYRFVSEASSASMGLVLSGVMRSEEFAAWYGSFARVVPIEALGSGSAPLVLPAPQRVWERFMTRLRRLHAPDWQRIVAVQRMLIDAVGGDPHQAALTAMSSFMETVREEGRLSEDSLSSISRCMDEITTIGDEYVNSMASLRDAMHASLTSKDPGSQNDELKNFANLQTADRAFVEDYRHCCRDGLFAVSLRMLVPEQHTMYLYLPFEAFVPLASLYA